MQSTSDNYDQTIIGLAYKIDQLNKEIETYKADRMLLEGKIKKLRTENKHLKARIGLYQMEKHHENKTTQHTSTNEVEWGEFSEISELTETDTEL
jgi:regulator of replication initiation timing